MLDGTYILLKPLCSSQTFTSSGLDLLVKEGAAVVCGEPVSLGSLLAV